MYNLLKSIIDIIVALCIFILLFPLLLLFTVILYFSNDGKPFFTQIRPGKNADLFKIVKFKTMNDRKDNSGNLLPDDLRLTRVGNFVRKTSLDELPQLINVIKGDMSIVGPRPLLPQYLELYSKTQSRRHEVKPGITGWAQVNGRNAISWEEKFKLDVWYVDNQNFKVDIVILFKTVQKVLFPEGISDGVSSTMLNFKGSTIEDNKSDQLP
jgi:lipopolysaccharide/colanic/teichoic acid biosynthesis glycosyltransferase